MSIKKLEDGQYEVDIRPAGRNGRRIRRKFSKKFEAINFERHTMATYSTKEWQPKLKDKRKLSELIDKWWSFFGKNNDHGLHLYKKSMRVCEKLNDPASFQITKKMIAGYQEMRLSSGVKPSTVNRELFGLSGIFTQLIKAELFSGEHPLRHISALKEKAPEMSYLTPEEIKLLLDALDKDERNIAILCLSTGARWSEAMKLKREHIIQNKVRFTYTKTGVPRIVPISKKVAELICEGKSGLLFSSVKYHSFRNKLKSIKPSLPSGQATHVLRHTFATHFMMNGGSIITLQRILGHSNLEQTLTYAHFAPDFLQDAISCNPLKGDVSL